MAADATWSVVASYVIMKQSNEQSNEQSNVRSVIFTLLVASHTVGFAACSDSATSAAPDAATTNDAPVPALSDADCPAFARNAVAASATCGAPLPSNAEAILTSFCKKGVKAAAVCGGDPAAGLACFKTADATDFACVATAIYPSCDGDLPAALGMYCVIALGNPQCASGIKCNFDADCSGNSACNDATGQCFAKAASCIGLPCTFDVDFPSNEKCNDAEHACVAR